MQLVSSIDLRHHTISALAITPDGTRVAIATATGRLITNNVGEGRRSLLYEDEGTPLHQLVVGYSGRLYAASSNTVTCWETIGGTWRPHRRGDIATDMHDIQQITVAPNEQTVAVLHGMKAERRVCVCNLRKGTHTDLGYSEGYYWGVGNEPINVPTHQLHSTCRPVDSAYYAAPSGRTVVYIAHGGISIRNSGEQIASRGHGWPILPAHVAFTRSEQLALCITDKRTHTALLEFFYSRKAEYELEPPKKELPTAYNPLAVSPSGRVVVGLGSEVRVYKF